MTTNGYLMDRGDTAANWTSNDPILRNKQFGFETDTLKFKMGDGVTAWTGLSYAGGAALDAFLTSIAALGTAADRIIYTTGVDTAAETPLTAAARTVLDDATVAAMVDTLGGAASTGAGGLARANGPTFIDPVLGTPASGNLANCEPIPQFSYTYTSSAATAAGARTIGLINTTAATARQIVPAGKSFKVLGVTASVESGATAGTYEIDAVIYNSTDAAETVLATFAVINANITAGVYAAGTVASPLATIAAGKAWSIGWNNNATSPGALSTGARVITITGIYV